MQLDSDSSALYYTRTSRIYWHSNRRGGEQRRVSFTIRFPCSVLCSSWMRWDRMYDALACLHNWPIHEVTACCGCKSALLDYWKWWSQSRRRRRREPTTARWVCSATRFDTHPRDTDPIYIYIYRDDVGIHTHTHRVRKRPSWVALYIVYESAAAMDWRKFSAPTILIDDTEHALLSIHSVETHTQ